MQLNKLNTFRCILQIFDQPASVSANEGQASLTNCVTPNILTNPFWTCGKQNFFFNLREMKFHDCKAMNNGLFLIVAKRDSCGRLCFLYHCLKRNFCPSIGKRLLKSFSFRQQNAFPSMLSARVDINNFTIA